mmetsp:Transcript_12016/g.48369  ORF Transcript_12016/g.48369 Transcript_12016/m.48369 type:complete len:338 (+) Transcript_12016:1-1014(+)
MASALHSMLRRPGAIWIRRWSSCAPAYRTGPATLRSSDRPRACEVLYVVGGLYGNLAALEAIRGLARREERPGRVGIIFNGDFNFFNATAEAWLAVNSAVRDFRGAHDFKFATATRGNIEHEVAAHAGDPGAIVGCGCAYPAHVDPTGVVSSRAAAITRRLHAVASLSDAPTWIAPWLAALPATERVVVGGGDDEDLGTVVGVVHGDPDCLNGWALAADAVETDAVSAWCDEARVDVLASTHTCVAHLSRLNENVVVNNGAAGMPNFDGAWEAGLVTRVAARGAPAPPETPVYGATLARTGAAVDAIPLRLARLRVVLRSDAARAAGLAPRPRVSRD